MQHLIRRPAVLHQAVEDPLFGGAEFVQKDGPLCTGKHVFKLAVAFP